MKHKRSLEALIVGFVLAIAVSFFSTKKRELCSLCRLFKCLLFTAARTAGTGFTMSAAGCRAAVPTAARICKAKSAASA